MQLFGVASHAPHVSHKPTDHALHSEPCGKASFGCALQQQLCRHGAHGPNSSHVARPHSTVPNSSSDVDIMAMPMNTDMVVTWSLGSNLRAVGMSSFRLM